METHVPVEGPGEGQESEDQGWRVKNAGLKVAEEWGAAKIARAPVGDNSALQGLAEKIFRWIKPPVNVTEEEGAVREKKGMKKKKHQEGRHSGRSKLYQMVRSHRRLFALPLLARSDPAGRAKPDAGNRMFSQRIV